MFDAVCGRVNRGACRDVGRPCARRARDRYHEIRVAGPRRGRPRGPRAFSRFVHACRSAATGARPAPLPRWEHRGFEAEVAMNFAIQVSDRIDKTVQVVRIAGELDHDTVRAAERRFSALTAKPPPYVVLDLADLLFL